MSIRYMGTKRHIADRVREAIVELAPRGRVLDLFSGVGCVAESLAGLAPVCTNDSLAFTAVLARARFSGERRECTANDLISLLRSPFRDTQAELSGLYGSKLKDEQRALDTGPAALSGFMAEAKHVGNDRRAASRARRADSAGGDGHYCLATLYFASGYFSSRQAIHLDALRSAIDKFDLKPGDRDWALAAWLSTAAAVINAPGHTAQYLKPTNKESYSRIRRCWRRNIWDVFQDRLVAIKPVGAFAWRRRNRVVVADALTLLRSAELPTVGAIYADPPYTKDQYSRYYHVYETLYKYDFPDSTGEGRVRSDRFTSSFCLRSGVVSAFADLFDAVAALKVPLVLSYPSDGLLSRAGSSVSGVMGNRMRLLATKTIVAEHSTLGASKGSKTKPATENLYVCVPH